MREWVALGIAASLVAASSAVAAEPARVRAIHVTDGVPLESTDPAWDRVPELKISLTPQVIVAPHGGGSISGVAVRAMHDGEWLAIRLEWKDPTADREVGVDTFRDAAAVGFPLAQSSPPASPFMGDAEHPVAIWQWTADLEAQARGRGGFADRYPHTDGVWYFPQDAAVHREVAAWRGTEPVEEFVATGWGTLERRPTRSVRASSAYAAGRWRLVLRRRLTTGDPNDAPFRPGEATQIIVAIWNGSAGEVNGRKSVTLAWTPLVLDATLEADGTP